MLLFWLSNGGNKLMWLATDDAATGGGDAATGGAAVGGAAVATDVRDRVDQAGAAPKRSPHVRQMSSAFIKGSECLYVFQGEATVEDDKLQLMKPLLGMYGALLSKDISRGLSSPPTSPSRYASFRRRSEDIQQDVLSLIKQDRDSIFPPELTLKGALEGSPSRRVTLFGDLCERLEEIADERSMRRVKVRMQGKEFNRQRTSSRLDIRNGQVPSAAMHRAATVSLDGLACKSPKIREVLVRAGAADDVKEETSSASPPIASPSAAAPSPVSPSRGTQLAWLTAAEDEAALERAEQSPASSQSATVLAAALASARAEAKVAATRATAAMAEEAMAGAMAEAMAEEARAAAMAAAMAEAKAQAEWTPPEARPPVVVRAKVSFARRGGSECGTRSFMHVSTVELEQTEVVPTHAAARANQLRL